MPKLKALQVSENPLVYPVRKIVVEGTKAIKSYLKGQYDKCNPPHSPTNSDSNIKSEEDLTLSEEDLNCDHEKLLYVVEGYNSGNEVHKTGSKTSKSSRKSNKSSSSKQSLSATMKKQLSDPHRLVPTLNVRKLTSQQISKRNLDQQPMRIVHKISKTPSKISLKSYFNRVSVRHSNAKIEDNNLRIGWLNQLRILLNDQEKILQQER